MATDWCCAQRLAPNAGPVVIDAIGPTGIAPCCKLAERVSGRFVGVLEGALAFNSQIRSAVPSFVERLRFCCEGCSLLPRTFGRGGPEKRCAQVGLAPLPPLAVAGAPPDFDGKKHRKITGGFQHIFCGISHNNSSYSYASNQARCRSAAVATLLLGEKYIFFMWLYVLRASLEEVNGEFTKCLNIERTVIIQKFCDFLVLRFRI